MRPPGARPNRRYLMDTQKTKVFRPERATDDPHAMHACSDGFVFMTYMAFDEEIGDEAEFLEVVPCRRCAEEAA
jgi:hypothetical protein